MRNGLWLGVLALFTVGALAAFYELSSDQAISIIVVGSVFFLLMGLVVTASPTRRVAHAQPGVCPVVGSAGLGGSVLLHDGRCRRRTGFPRRLFRGHDLGLCPLRLPALHLPPPPLPAAPCFRTLQVGFVVWSDVPAFLRLRRAARLSRWPGSSSCSSPSCCWRPATPKSRMTTTCAPSSPSASGDARSWCWFPWSACWPIRKPWPPAACMTWAPRPPCFRWMPACSCFSPWPWHKPGKPRSLILLDPRHSGHAPGRGQGRNPGLLLRRRGVLHAARQVQGGSPFLLVRWPWSDAGRGLHSSRFLSPVLSEQRPGGHASPAAPTSGPPAGS